MTYTPEVHSGINRVDCNGDLARDRAKTSPIAFITQFLMLIRSNVVLKYSSLEQFTSSTVSELQIFLVNYQKHKAHFSR